MNRSNYCLDTNVLIHYLKGRSTNLTHRLNLTDPTRIKLSAIVKTELLYGAYRSNNRNKALQAVEMLLSPLEILPFDSRTAEILAEIKYDLEKRGQTIGPHDLIIASTVLAQPEPYTLVTNNTKEFSRIKNLKLEDWL